MIVVYDRLMGNDDHPNGFAATKSSGKSPPRWQRILEANGVSTLVIIGATAWVINSIRDVDKEITSVKGDVKRVEERLNAHLKWVETGYGTPDSPKRPTPTGTSTAPSPPPSAIASPRWSPEFIASREGFCGRQCGGALPETECHGECRAHYLQCGIDNAADPKDPGLQRCVATFKPQ